MERIPIIEKITNLDERFIAAFEKWKADPRRDVTQKKSQYLGKYVELKNILEHCVERMEKCVEDFELMESSYGEPQVASVEELRKL